MQWKDGRLTHAVLRSANGGVCRLRSLAPLKGKGLRKAKGQNPNPTYAPPDDVSPIISPEATIALPTLPKTYLYDLDTRPGTEYILL